MKGYASLIRLKKFALDGLRQRLEARDEDRRRLLGEVEVCEASILMEQLHASEGDLGPADYAAFVAAERGRQARLRTEADEIAKEVETLRDELRVAYQDLKTMEKLEADRLLALAEEAQAKERAALDETATLRHDRR